MTIGVGDTVFHVDDAQGEPELLQLVVTSVSPAGHIVRFGDADNEWRCDQRRAVVPQTIDAAVQKYQEATVFRFGLRFPLGKVSVSECCRRIIAAERLRDALPMACKPMIPRNNSDMK